MFQVLHSLSVHPLLVVGIFFVCGVFTAVLPMSSSGMREVGDVIRCPTSTYRPAPAVTMVPRFPP